LLAKILIEEEKPPKKTSLYGIKVVYVVSFDEVAQARHPVGCTILISQKYKLCQKAL
jgi:hypothetical protein